MAGSFGMEKCGRKASSGYEVSPSAEDYPWTSKEILGLKGSDTTSTDEGLVVS